MERFFYSTLYSKSFQDRLPIMVLRVFVIPVVFALHVTASGRCCLSGWIAFEDSCYLFADETSVDWTEATHFCDAHGHSHLVTVESQDEDKFIKDHCRRLFKADDNQRFWLGATDDEVEGVWVWYSNHQKLSGGYTGWDPSEPDDGGTQDCALFYGPFAYAWGSYFCAQTAHPICEMNSTNGEWQEIIG